MEEKQKIININIAEVIKLLYADRKKVCIYAFVAGIIGVALAFGTPKIYKSTVILAPEESGAGFSGSISSLASMVGMNMKIGQTGDALYPEIYPDLMNSTDFLVGLFPIKVTKDKTGDTFTYQDYIQNHQKLAVSDYPKALIVNLIEKFKEEIPRYMVKHQVRPGLTGWAQVNGLRGDTDIKKRIEYDLYYIENWTFWFDIKIIILTFFKGFINKNAY